MISKNIYRGAVSAILPVMVLLLAFLASCGGSHSGASSDKGDEIEMRYADYLSISEHPGYTEVTVRNPWDSVRTLQRYILVASDSAMPANLPQGTIIRTPVSNALIYSTVHCGLLSELGATEAIGGICNSSYVTDSDLKSRISSGRIADCGMSHNPDMERIIQLHPQVIMLSPFENNDKYAKVGDLGIPIVECADYMETSPLGRAEWVRFYGLLFGVREKSEKMFADTEREYLRLKEIAGKSDEAPMVLTDQRYGQIWNVPAANSTMGRLIEDAGGKNPFADYNQSGSVALSPEKVLATAHDAPIWFIRYNQDGEKTLKELASDAPVNSQFLAYKEGNVYGCNTRYINIFDETAFHPERLLRDMIIRMHPGILGDEEAIYYKKMK